MDLYVSSPLRNVADIKKSMKKIVREKKDILFSVNNAKKNPYFNMVEFNKGKFSIVKKKKTFIHKTVSAKSFWTKCFHIYMEKKNIITKKYFIYEI